LKLNKDKMKILVLVHVQTEFGGYWNIHEFCKVLVDKGHEVTYVSTSNRNRFRFNTFMRDGVEIVETPDWLWGKLRNGADLFNAFMRAVYFLRKSYDLVYGIDSRPTVIVPSLALKYIRKIPFVQDWHDSYGHGGTIAERSSRVYARTVGHVETFFEEFFRKYADYGLVATSFLRDRLLKLGYPPSKVLIHRIGSIKKEFTILSKQQAREQLSLSQDHLYFGYLGGIYRNDAEFLFDAMEVLLARDLPVKLLLIGRNRLFESAPDRAPYLTVTGPLEEDDVMMHLQACDGLLLPLKASAANLARWPSKVNHYMLSGRPIISTPVSDFKEIFIEHELGIVSEDDSVDSFSKSLLRFIESRDRWPQYGRNCQKYFDENLDYNVITEKMLNFLEV
jgi:glycosyltransferase involved in cell wall biosynthesis